MSVEQLVLRRLAAGKQWYCEEEEAGKDILKLSNGKKKVLFFFFFTAYIQGLKLCKKKYIILQI